MIAAIHGTVKENRRELRAMRDIVTQHGLQKSGSACTPVSLALRCRLPVHSRADLRCLDNDLAADETLFRELVSERLQIHENVSRYFRVALLLQVNLLTVTGLDANTNKSVGAFVANAVERVADKRLLSVMSWMGTNEKAASIL